MAANDCVYDYIFKSNLAKSMLDCGDIVQAGKTKRSYCFICDRTMDKIGKREDLVRWQYETLRKVFGFEDTESTRTLFHKSATSKEAWRINIIWSSALLPFLIFHSVSKDNPIKILLSEYGEREFTCVDFEWQNKIVNGGGASCVDVVLSNEDGEMLFLESKLTEYLRMTCRGGDVLPCVTYGDQYDRLFSRPWNGYSISKQYTKDKKGRPAFRIVTQTPHYLTGIKQMVSHFMGIRDNLGCRIKCKVAYLAEVLFDFRDEISIKGIDPLADYKQMHSELVRHLRREESRVAIVPEVLTYQACASGLNLPNRVLDFYRLNENSAEEA